MIVSLGLMPQLWQLGVLLLAVAVLTVHAFIINRINRLTGIPYPAWNRRASRHRPHDHHC